MGNLWDFLITTWPGQLICALLCWAMAVLKYSHISRGEMISRFHWFDLIVYGALGKWGMVYLWAFFGALFTFVGIWNLVVRILYGKSDDE